MKHRQKIKQKRIALLFHRIGVIAMLLLILLCAPFTLPKLFGMQIYEVKTESMEPTYPVGSVVYVKQVKPSDIVIGDVITYVLGTDTEFVMTHRVVDILEEEQSFVTKGDANAVEDAEPVKWSRLVGCPVCCIAGIAVIADFINSSEGRAAIICVFAIVLAIWLVSDWMQRREEVTIAHRK